MKSIDIKQYIAENFSDLFTKEKLSEERVNTLVSKIQNRVSEGLCPITTKKQITVFLERQGIVKTYSL